MSRIGHSMRATALGALVLALAACGGRQPAERAAVEYKGTNPQAGSPAAVTPQAVAPVAPTSPGGIVSYEGYQAAVAREGDTVASVAQRIGLSASELGAYNGLTPEHRLRAGDELVLPPRPGGYAGGTPQPPAGTATEVARLEPLAAPGSAPGSVPNTAPGGVDGSGIEAAPLETAPPAGSGQASGGWSEWSPDLAAQAIERSASPGQQGSVGAPPSAGAPLPPAPEAPRPLASPQLGQYQTGASAQPPAPRPVETITTPAEQPVEQAAVEPEPEPEPALAAAPEPAAPRVAVAAPAAGDLSLIRPVSGPVVVGFQQGGGRSGNDGVDFAAPAGSPVVAAAAGEVALVSQSLGGLGTIVLVRHPGDFLTVYGRIDRVTVQKGDLVAKGQQIGVVASNPTPRMHFEVRKGAESLDPERFFRG